MIIIPIVLSLVIGFSVFKEPKNVPVTTKELREHGTISRNK